MATMLRSVLRNVQYYFLFFSTLLVFLAFQRLQILDRGWMAPNPFSDRPNNYDYEGRVLNWSGDDNSSRSIGLFKFKLGLFEFVLPTWSMTDDHEDNIINANRLRLSVPNPTRRKKKDEKANRIKQTKKWDIDEHTNTHITSHIDQSSQHLQQIQEKLNEEKKLATVAYIIIIPNDDGSKRWWIRRWQL